MMYSFTAFLVFSVSLATVCQGRVKVYKQPGDLIIGGMVPLHFYNETTRTCSRMRGVSALRRVEGIAYAVSLINNDSTILGGITLGFEIYDTCSSTSETLKNALNFIPSMRESDDVIGVVGPQRSSSSIQATTLLGIYNISTISFLSTSDELSNSERYPYFLRTVPPDKFQVSVITDLLVQYDWKYVAFLYSDDSYGKNAEVEFRMQAEANGICIGYARSLVANQETVEEVVGNLLTLKDESLISVVIIFTQIEEATQIFEQAGSVGIQRDFIWIGSDGWGNYGLEPVGPNGESVLGAFTVVPKAGSHDDFNEYFLKSQTESSNPWLPELLAECNCDVITELPQPPYESVVIDSVEVFARALQNMKELECASLNKTECLDFLLKNRRLLRDYLLRVSFPSVSNGQVSFTADGDSNGRYDIRNLILANGSEYHFENVGTWIEATNTDGESLDVRDLMWYVKNKTNPDTYTARNIPKSICSDPCKPLEVMRVTLQSCCWKCDACGDEEIIFENECRSCFDHENKTYRWPNKDLSHCEPLDHLQLVDEVENVILLLAAVLGIFGEVFVAYFYIKNREKRLIKASSRELGYIILVGIILVYLSAILFCTPPNVLFCVLRRIVPHIGSSFIYTSILTMTVRLYRIFSSGKKTKKRPSFISPKSQVFLTLTISLLPLTWGIVWIFLEPPVLLAIEPSRLRQYIELSCVVSNVHRMGQLCWDVLIVILCCYFAIKTRNLPANYNQTRFIAFSVFSTLVVYVAFAPAFFTSQESNQQDLYSALGSIIQSTVVLILIFVVRIYAIYFVKEEDQQIITTRPSMRQPSEADHMSTIASSPVRTISTSALNHSVPPTPNGVNKSLNDLCTQTSDAEFNNDRVYKFLNGNANKRRTSITSIEYEIEDDPENEMPPEKAGDVGGEGEEEEGRGGEEEEKGGKGRDNEAIEEGKHQEQDRQNDQNGNEGQMQIV